MAKKTSRKQKHIPQRMCIACRQRYDKRRLTRVVNTQEDGVVVDLTGKRNGRGAYLCDQPGCWDKAVSSEQLINQALKCQVSAQERAALAEYKPVVNQVME